MNCTWERLALSKNSVSIGEVGNIIFTWHVVSLVDSQIGKGLSWISGINLVGGRGLVDHVECSSQNAWVSAISELSSLNSKLD